jgi:hypothetical protein
MGIWSQLWRHPFFKPNNSRFNPEPLTIVRVIVRVGFIRRLTIAVFTLAASVMISGQARAASSICNAISGNLVANSGFETGDFTGWTLSGNSAGFGAEVTTQPVNSGNDAVAFGAAGTDALLSQTFTDVANALLTFSFYLRSSAFGANSNNFSVLFDSTTLESVTNLAAQDFTQVSFAVTGTGSDTITFEARDDNSFLGLDDVVVARVCNSDHPPRVPPSSPEGGLSVVAAKKSPTGEGGARFRGHQTVTLSPGRQ